MNNTCRIASTRFGSLLGKQRPTWDFSSDEARLQVQGKRALWLLANPDIVEVNLNNCKAGEDFDEAGEGLGRLINVGTSITTLLLANNQLGKLDWRKQQFTRALSGSESLTMLNLRNNNLESTGVRMVCSALLTCKNLKTLDISYNRPFREPALPLLLRNHPNLTDVGIIEEGKGKLDPRAKIIIGQALTERANPRMFAIQNDVFQVHRDTTSVDWPATAEHGDVLMLAGILQTNTSLTSFSFRPDNLNDDDQEILGQALLKHRAGRLGYAPNFGLHPPKEEAPPSPPPLEESKVARAARAASPPARGGKGGKPGGGEEAAKADAGEEAVAKTSMSYDVKNREVIRSARSFVLLAGILKGNRVVTSLTFKSLDLNHVPHLGASLRCNDTLKELKLIRERGRVVTLDVQKLTGRQPKANINLCPSLGATGSDAESSEEPDKELDKELLDRVCVALVGDLLAENQTTHTLRLNPGTGTEGGMVVQYLDAAKKSALRTLDLNGIKLGDRGAPELFQRLQVGMCSMLTALTLRSNNLTDANLDSLVTALASDHCALTSLDLSDNPSVSSELLLKALMGNRTLTSLSLCGCPKLTEDVEKIGLFLGHEMCSCPVGFININLPEGGRDKEVKKNEKKVGEVFSITESDVEVAITNPRALDLFVGLLRWNRLIRKVDLSAVLVENAKAIEFALNTNQVLEELDISRNSLHAEREANAIISGVSSSTSLKLIALDGKPLPINQLRGENAQQQVDFSEYSLDILSARVVASLLGSNTSLVQLFMQSNHLCAVGVEALASSLAHSPARDTLKVLDLSRNSIGSTEEAALKEGKDSKEAKEKQAQGGEVEEGFNKKLGIAGIFAALGELTNLENLLLDENELESISCLHQLKNLRRLSLRANKLRSLPNEMGILKTLQDLMLADNQITRLPRHIGGLRSIQRLDLKGNDLAALPAAVGKLTSLKTLDISDNRRITALPRTMYDLSKELKLVISPAMRGLNSPPYAAVKSGIAEMRKWWDLNEGSKPVEEDPDDPPAAGAGSGGGGGGASSNGGGGGGGDDAAEEEKAAASGQGESNSGSTSSTSQVEHDGNLPVRVTKRRPMRKPGESSRHVWAEHESEPVLVINFFNAEMGQVFGDLAGAPTDRDAEILMTNEEVGLLKAQEFSGQEMAERIKLHNTWQCVDVEPDATIGLSTKSPIIRVTIDFRIKSKTGYLQIMPHLGYACAVGMRLEFRQPVYQMDVQKTTYTNVCHSGCATVVEVKGSDVVCVRFDNSSKMLDLDA